MDSEGEIRPLYTSDQTDREAYAKKPVPEVGLAIKQKDEQRLQKAREILAQGPITNPHALQMLAFVFQHGETVNDIRTALKLTTQAVEAGLPPQYSLIPQATDRLMIREQLDRGIPLEELTQKYGTETMFNPDGKPLVPKLDGTATEEELKKFGLI